MKLAGNTSPLQTFKSKCRAVFNGSVPKLDAHVGFWDPRFWDTPIQHGSFYWSRNGSTVTSRKHQKHLWYLIPVLTKHELKGQICFRTPNRHSSNSSNMCQLTMFPAVHTARHGKNWNAQSAAESAMVLPCHFQHRLHRTTGRWDHCLGLSWETVGQLGWSYIWHLMILCSQLGPA